MATSSGDAKSMELREQEEVDSESPKNLKRERIPDEKGDPENDENTREVQNESQEDVNQKRRRIEDNQNQNKNQIENQSTLKNSAPPMSFLIMNAQVPESPEPEHYVDYVIMNLALMGKDNINPEHIAVLPGHVKKLKSIEPMVSISFEVLDRQLALELFRFVCRADFLERADAQNRELFQKDVSKFVYLAVGLHNRYDLLVATFLLLCLPFLRTSSPKSTFFYTPSQIKKKERDGSYDWITLDNLFEEKSHRQRIKKTMRKFTDSGREQVAQIGKGYGIDYRFWQ